MNLVLISSESRYPVSKRQIRKTVSDCLEKFGLQETEVSVAVVGTRKIRQLNRDYRKVDEETAVLTFALEEPRDREEILRLGDIVICYPSARELAQEENILVRQAIDKLLIHGLNNLLGNPKNANHFLSCLPTAKF